MGELLTYTCGACGFGSGLVMVGRGFSGIQHAPIGCGECRTVYSVVVETWRDGVVGAAPSANAWNRGDPCPEGHDGARLLESTAGASERRCPACGERDLEVAAVGRWD
jgi:predicted RNA-binding Zn-ribbon protein involved in translation (DUF1610 family)